MESSPQEADALVEQRGHTLIVTMNLPHRRNALSTEMMDIMVQVWDRVDNDDDIRCCILTGAGGYFCAGMDLKTATQKQSTRSPTRRNSKVRPETEREVVVRVALDS
nr:enoyl-CoA hydratase-related protein [Mycobacterium tilburgii]